MTKKKPWVDRNCPVCGELIDPEWAETKTKFCSRRCLNKDYYDRKKAEHHKRYLKDKRAWEKSPIGKRAGVSIYKWKQIPKFFRES